MKLVTAFANTSGGLIIFGVDDATRSPVKSTIRPNIDKLSQSAKQYLTNPPAIAYREYSSPRIGKFDVLIVYPKNKGELPTKFAKTIGNAKVDSLWVRIGHETILAQAKHIPIIFRSELESSGVGDSTVEHALPPSPSTIKRFVGRLSTIYKVFEWLHSQPPKAKIASYKLFSSEKSLPTNGVSFEVRSLQLFFFSRYEYYLVNSWRRAGELLQEVKDPIGSAARCGLEMSSTLIDAQLGWEVRVGVHSGPVVAGVVGQERYQFDIWGDTVNVAARMSESPNLEKSSHEGCLGERPARLHGEALGEMEVKGKGTISVFGIRPRIVIGPDLH